MARPPTLSRACGLLLLAVLAAGCGAARAPGESAATADGDAATDGSALTDEARAILAGPRPADALAAGDLARRAPAEAWQTLFDGNTLAGWVPVNHGPDTWRVREGLLVCSGRPTGVMRTHRQYENFVLELEWRHLVPGGNAGLFVWSDALPVRGQPFTRSIEVQVMDGQNTPEYTSHGDLFSIHGARMQPDRPHPSGWERCLPSEQRCRPSPAWNHYRLIALDGTLTLEVNGAKVSGAQGCTPRKGYLCLESEGSEVHFRRLRLLELPPTPGLRPADVAALSRGERRLYNGHDFAGWLDPAGGPIYGGVKHWMPQDWRLTCAGRGPTLKSMERFGDVALVADWRWPEAPLVPPAGAPAPRLPLLLRGAFSPEVPPPETPRAWQRAEIELRGDRVTLRIDGKPVLQDAPQPDLPLTGPLALLPSGQKVEFANLFVWELP